MSGLDVRLVQRVEQLRQELGEVERALPPIQSLVDAALEELRVAVEHFRAAPFQISVAMPTTLGAVVPEHWRSSAVAVSQMGAWGYFEPVKTKRLVEEATRRRAEASGGLRLDPETKERRLAELRQQLVRALASLELHRRELEAAGEPLFARDGYDPGTWLQTTEALERLAA
jgi:hypothetical protein